MWFKKKKILKIPRVFEFPEDERLYFLKLLDALKWDEKNLHARTYMVWKYVNDAFPETKNGSRNLVTSQPTNPKIVERFVKE